jgi:hypothetical protein
VIDFTCISKKQSFESGKSGEGTLLGGQSRQRGNRVRLLRLQREGIEPKIYGDMNASVLMLKSDDNPHPGGETRDLLQGNHLDRVFYSVCIALSGIYNRYM